MQQEMCFGCEVCRLAIWHDVLEYSFEFVALIIQGMSSNLSATTLLCFELVLYFDATDLELMCNSF